MKRILAVVLVAALILGFGAGCKTEQSAADAIEIILSDEKITVGGKGISGSRDAAVYAAKDIVYYESGKDFSYGEGTEKDAHTAQEADEHTVVHITKAGKYILKGSLSKGQIAVDLGKDAKDDETAVVTLVLDGADISCSVAPAVIFYRVYECGDKEDPKRDVDTSKAGANVILSKGSVNNVSGSYVAKIYDPETVELNEAGTKVEDAEKLHKYDGAFYSKMSMNISGEGTLNIAAQNEGLGTEMHLTINGGTINIDSGNDGINTNEDEVSVTTINGGEVNINVNGKTGEGDGIDSNGWIVINGGKVFAQACANSADSGIDSDMGIHINGGSVFATGNMLDRISESEQNFAVFTFNSKQRGEFSLRNSEGKDIAKEDIKNQFSYLIISAENMAEGEYTLWNGEAQMQGIAAEGGMGGRPQGGGMRPEWQAPNDLPDGATILPAIPGGEWEGPQLPEGWKPADGARPEMPEGSEPPQGFEPPQNGENFPQGGAAEPSDIFKIAKGGNYFINVAPKGE